MTHGAVTELKHRGPPVFGRPAVESGNLALGTTRLPVLEASEELPAAVQISVDAGQFAKDSLFADLGVIDLPADASDLAGASRLSFFQIAQHGSSPSRGKIYPGPPVAGRVKCIFTHRQPRQTMSIPRSRFRARRPKTRSVRRVSSRYAAGIEREASWVCNGRVVAAGAANSVCAA